MEGLLIYEWGKILSQMIYENVELPDKLIV